jgi:ABC-type transport system involved in Fe-S cluster assembly fused permease/ATPase subunit
LNFSTASQPIIDAPNAVALPRARGEILFKNVGFTYGTTRSAVHGIDLTIPCRQHLRARRREWRGEDDFARAPAAAV